MSREKATVVAAMGVTHSDRDATASSARGRSARMKVAAVMAEVVAVVVLWSPTMCFNSKFIEHNIIAGSNCQPNLVHTLSNY